MSSAYQLPTARTINLWNEVCEPGTWRCLSWWVSSWWCPKSLFLSTAPWTWLIIQNNVGWGIMGPGWIPNLLIVPSHTQKKKKPHVWSAVLELMEMLDLDQLFRNGHKCSFVRFYSGGGCLNSQLKSEKHTSLCTPSALPECLFIPRLRPPAKRSRAI